MATATGTGSARGSIATHVTRMASRVARIVSAADSGTVQALRARDPAHLTDRDNVRATVLVSRRRSATADVPPARIADPVASADANA